MTMADLIPDYRALGLSDAQIVRLLAPWLTAWRVVPVPPFDVPAGIIAYGVPTPPTQVTP